VIEPVLTREVEAYLETISPKPPWKHWFLVPSDRYLVKRRRVGGHLADGVVHTPDCRFAAKQVNTARISWEKITTLELIYYWWDSAIGENPRKAGRTPPELTGFVKFCTTCTVVKPHYHKAREIYERAHPRPE
jgi:hypothetical protein